MFLDNLAAQDGKWIFKKILKAQKNGASCLLNIIQNYYTGMPSAVMFKTVGDYCDMRFQKNIIIKA